MTEPPHHQRPEEAGRLHHFEPLEPAQGGAQRHAPGARGAQQARHKGALIWIAISVTLASLLTAALLFILLS